MHNSSLTAAENVARREAQRQAQANKNLREKSIINYYTAKRKQPKFERKFHVGDIAKYYTK